LLSQLVELRKVGRSRDDGLHKSLGKSAKTCFAPFSYPYFHIDFDPVMVSRAVYSLFLRVLLLQSQVVLSSQASGLPSQLCQVEKMNNQ